MSGGMTSLDLSVLQARGAGVEGRYGFCNGISIVRAGIRPILGPEASPEWVLRTKRVKFLSNWFSMGHPNGAWGWGSGLEISVE